MVIRPFVLLICGELYQHVHVNMTFIIVVVVVSVQTSVRPFYFVNMYKS